MRKILLGTTGVVGAAIIGMGVAQAQQAPSVRVGGFMQSTFVYIDDDLDAGNGAPTGVAGAGRVARAETDFRNEVEVHVLVTGKAANGLSYGAVIELQNDGTNGSVVDLDEAYVFVSSPTLGTIRFGEEDSAASIMQVRAPSITGFGSDGAFDVGILNNSADRSGGNPSLLTGINDGNDATKIVYLSPQFFGFDFGLSYAPNTGEGDRPFNSRAVDTFGVAGGAAVTANNTQRDSTTLENEISAALRYRGTFGGVGIAAGFGYMQADAPSVTGAGAPRSDLQDVEAFTFGGQVSAFGFTVGGEYTWGKWSGAGVGRAALANGRDESDLFVVGATYVIGAFSVGAFYGMGNQDNGGTVADREQTGWGLGIAYAVAPGLEVFANYNSFEDSNVRITANGGTLVDREFSAFFLGTRLAF
jgi:predicted porin